MPINRAKTRQKAVFAFACEHCKKQRRGCDVEKPCSRCVQKGINCVTIGSAAANSSFHAGEGSKSGKVCPAANATPAEPKKTRITPKRKARAMRDIETSSEEEEDESSREDDRADEDDEDEDDQEDDEERLYFQDSSDLSSCSSHSSDNCCSKPEMEVEVEIPAPDDLDLGLTPPTKKLKLSSSPSSSEPAEEVEEINKPAAAPIPIAIPVSKPAIKPAAVKPVVKPVAVKPTKPAKTAKPVKQVKAVKPTKPLPKSVEPKPTAPKPIVASRPRIVSRDSSPPSLSPISLPTRLPSFSSLLPISSLEETKPYTHNYTTTLTWSSIQPNNDSLRYSTVYPPAWSTQVSSYDGMMHRSLSNQMSSSLRSTAVESV